MIQNHHQQGEKTLNIRHTGDELYCYVLCDRRVTLTTSLETLPHHTHALVWCYAMSFMGNSDPILQPYVITNDFTSEVPQVCFVLSFLGTDATLSGRVPPLSHSGSSHPGFAANAHYLVYRSERCCQPQQLSG